MKEPALMRCAVREGDDEWHIECRFSDGQKYAAIKLDGACPQLATRVAALLNGNIWTDERPTEAGEYWLSIAPTERTADGKKIPAVLDVRVSRSGLIEAEGCRGWSALSDPMLNGAKWSRRETPADPFEVTG